MCLFLDPGMTGHIFGVHFAYGTKVISQGVEEVQVHWLGSRWWCTCSSEKWFWAYFLLESRLCIWPIDSPWHSRSFVNEFDKWILPNGFQFSWHSCVSLRGQGSDEWDGKLLPEIQSTNVRDKVGEAFRVICVTCSKCLMRLRLMSTQ